MRAKFIVDIPPELLRTIPAPFISIVTSMAHLYSSSPHDTCRWFLIGADILTSEQASKFVRVSIGPVNQYCLSALANSLLSDALYNIHIDQINPVDIPDSLEVRYLDY